MILFIQKQILIKLLVVFVITFLTPVISKNSTKQSNTNLTSTNQRLERPFQVINRLTETHKIRNVTNPKIIERNIPLTSPVSLSSLLTAKVTNISKPEANNTNMVIGEIGELTTSSPTINKITNSEREKFRNSVNTQINSTNVAHIFKINNSDEIREQNLNEINLTKIISAADNISFTDPSSHSDPVINHNLDFYLDPIYPNLLEQVTDHSQGIGIANLTEGFDSFLINENINAFTTGSTSCPKCKCGVKTLKKVIGGNVIKRNEYPWIALLTYNGKFFCAGSLINNLYIVTAAHCTTTFRKDEIVIYFQDIKKDNGNVLEIIMRKVSNVYRPLNFNQNTFFNDISLLKLSEEIDISSGLLRPICLPIDKTSFVGKVGTITGWRLNKKNEISINLIRMVNTTVLSNRQCRSTLVGKMITPTMICSTATPSTRIGSESECRGDSGSPLMVTQKGRSRLAGIVSWGLGCKKKNASDVFTRTTKYNGWLRKLSQDACWCN